ncbi:DUF86 domain-containing protein [Patescibacteria group bacterium]|nr:MAG: DUF86 domain-containing protein [Patescibacteria group bacterium]
MTNKTLIYNKLTDIGGYQKELDALLEDDVFDLIQDETKLHAIERLFQLIVDCMVDINTHIIAEKNLQAPEDYQSTFITLGQNKILPMAFALKLAPIVGLRNRIVHKYEDIDMKRFLTELKAESGDIKKFMKIIGEYIK